MNQHLQDLNLHNINLQIGEHPYLERGARQRGLEDLKNLREKMRWGGRQQGGKLEE